MYDFLDDDRYAVHAEFVELKGRVVKRWETRVQITTSAHNCDVIYVAARLENSATSFTLCFVCFTTTHRYR
ncbi:hypothetical protein CHS0354_041656 [Potamilus streckersoni]|uniref:Uncharacterized protein n=1 Tax=Potamilus streckersoni TaxID=2493646 RepID=A0AAE0VUE2_9BIVA|nr:hypothetical protein CHS0354_041656 [Potamilus streckersoni]